MPNQPERTANARLRAITRKVCQEHSGHQGSLVPHDCIYEAAIAVTLEWAAEQLRDWHEPTCSVAYPHNAQPGSVRRCNCGVALRAENAELRAECASIPAHFASRKELARATSRAEAAEAKVAEQRELLIDAVYQWGAAGNGTYSPLALSTMENIFAALGLEDRHYTAAELEAALRGRR